MAAEDTLKVVALASGRGTNLQALIDRAKAAGAPFTMAGLVSDNPEAFALKRAEEAGIPSCVVLRKEFASRAKFDEALAGAVESFGAQLVCLAGFMRILSPGFLQRFKGRVINIHPSLLPAFPGLNAQAQALAHGVKVAGCTVHFVDEGVDTGPIISQAAVSVEKGDTEQTLSARILAAEHVIYPGSVELIAKGKIAFPHPFADKDAPKPEGGAS